MQWYEILIAAIALAIVLIPVIRKIKEIRTFLKTGKVKCNGNCSGCGCAHCTQATSKHTKER